MALKPFRLSNIRAPFLSIAHFDLLLVRLLLLILLLITLFVYFTS